MENRVSTMAAPANLKAVPADFALDTSDIINVDSVADPYNMAKH
jgi:hypothetical protein